MKGHNRKFYSASLNHCYQNTKNGYLLFYTVFDCLVFFTIFCTTAARYNVKVYKLCLMPDHIHISVYANSRKELYSFIRDYTKLFSKIQNEYYGRSGALFNSPFGSTPKTDIKKIRTNLIYVDNNPVERCLTEKAEDFRWNFIAFAVSAHPFSDPIDPNKASKKMKLSMALVQERQRANKPLNYQLANMLFKNLDKKESEQLTDFIISTFSVIDHSTAIRFFGSYENMLTADHSTTGSEYEIREIFTGKSDKVYSQITALLLNSGRFTSIREVLRLSSDERFELFIQLSGKTAATPEQLAKYLRLPLLRKK